MNAKQLRTTLQDLLSDLLGKYSNGVPSIWVYGSGSKPPSSSNGLEVLINSSPEGDPRSGSGGTRYHPKYWELTLKNWKESPNLKVAVEERIQASFITRRYTYYPANEKTIEQARIYIFDPQMLPPRKMDYIPKPVEVTDQTEWIYQ